jgi:tRNA (Thr-GGU) A37 N-methylase
MESASRGAVLAGVALAAFGAGWAVSRWTAAAAAAATSDRGGTQSMLRPGPASSSPSSPPGSAAVAATKKPRPSPRGNDAVWPFQPIGLIESVFPGKRGTPRQGFLAPASRGRLVLRKGRGALSADSLDTVDKFSHVWVIFVFHDNTRKGQKGTQGQKGQDPGGGLKFQTPKSKVQPPKLGLAKVRVG